MEKYLTGKRDRDLNLTKPIRQKKCPDTRNKRRKSKVRVSSQGVRRLARPFS